MNATMDVRIVSQVIPADRVDHRLRLVCGGGIVEVNERLAGDRLLKDREIPTNPFDVKRASACIIGFRGCGGNGGFSMGRSC